MSDRPTLSCQDAQDRQQTASGLQAIAASPLALAAAVLLAAWALAAGLALSPWEPVAILAKASLAGLTLQAFFLLILIPILRRSQQRQRFQQQKAQVSQANADQ